MCIRDRAKDEDAQFHLSKQFFDRTVKRNYVALVWGNIQQENGTIEGNIGRDPNDRLKFKVFSDEEHGKPSITHYKVIERFGYVTMVECILETGRTHQIPVSYTHLDVYKRQEHRIAHMLRLRELQEITGGFNAFIPLKYSCANNSLSEIGEISQEEILRTIAISRLALDNIPHIKAYWPMLGKKTGILAMEYGADDMDGTIENSTKIYSMAGSEEQHPTLTVEELKELASVRGFHIQERRCV